MTSLMYYRSLAMTNKGFDALVAEMGFDQAKMEVFEGSLAYAEQSIAGTLPAEKDLLLNADIPEPVRLEEFRRRFTEVKQGNVHKAGDDIAEYFAVHDLTLPVFSEIRHQKNEWTWLTLPAQPPLKVKRNPDKWKA